MNNDPKNKKPQDNKPQNGDDGRQGRRIVFLMVAALIATLLINSLYTTIANAYLSEITYNEFQTYLDKDEIAELEFQSDRMVILTRDEAKKPSAQQRLYYTGYIPNVSNDELKARLDAQGVEYNTEIVEQASPIVTFVVTWLLPVIIMYALFSLLMRSMTKRMGGGIGGIGESKAKVYMEKETGVTTMYMDEGVDTGDIILQSTTPIGPEETVGQVHDRLAQLGGELLVQVVADIAASEHAGVLPICAEIEAEIAGMEPEEKELFLSDMGLTESGLDRLVKASYTLLGLISYLTSGEDECRAWTIKRGTKAPQAAGDRKSVV